MMVQNNIHLLGKIHANLQYLKTSLIVKECFFYLTANFGFTFVHSYGEAKA
uniref:Uncharacterized protein n=1 Tax=Rhizophora mucronata TaxID=61149 RepID=A0A2P2PFR4_RHIMU